MTKSFHSTPLQNLVGWGNLNLMGKGQADKQRTFLGLVPKLHQCQVGLDKDLDMAMV